MRLKACAEQFVVSSDRILKSEVLRGGSGRSVVNLGMVVNGNRDVTSMVLDSLRGLDSLVIFVLDPCARGFHANVF